MNPFRYDDNFYATDHHTSDENKIKYKRINDIANILNVITMYICNHVLKENYGTT